MLKNKKTIFILLFVLFNSQFTFSNNLSALERVKIKVKSFFYENILLAESINANDIKRVKYLLEECGADANYKLNDQFPVLAIAILNHNIEMVMLLLNHGADINLKDYRGRTQLHFAIAAEDINMIRLLLEKGADLNIKDEEGCTAIDYANYARYKNNNDIIIKLIKEYQNKKKR